MTTNPGEPGTPVLDVHQWHGTALITTCLSGKKATLTGKKTTLNFAVEPHRAMKLRGHGISGVLGCVGSV